MPTFQTLTPFLFVFLWSTGFIGAKYGLPYAEPLTFLLTRYCLVLGLMTTFALATRAPWPRDARQIFHIGVSGILQPLLTACGAGWLLGERVNSRQWLGLALGFIGVNLVVANKLGNLPLGAMMIPALVALLAITAGTLYQKRFCPHFDLRTGSVIQFLPSAVITALAASASETMVIDWTPSFVFALLWLVLVLSFAAISLLNVLIRNGSAVNVARLFYLTPPNTAIIACAVAVVRQQRGLRLGGPAG